MRYVKTVWGQAGRMIRGIGLMLTFGLLVGCEAEKPAPDLEKADLVFTNGRVYTLDETRPWAEAVAIKDDRILYVGSMEESRAYMGEATQVRDLGGKVMMPGFIDTHSHPIDGGGFVKALALDPFASVDAWLEAIKDYAATHPDMPIVFGYGYLATAFGEGGPTRQMLDEIVSDRPVLIMDEGFHTAWGNSRTLEKLGIGKETPDPVPGFSMYKRDENGHPTGWFLEGTAGMAMEDLNIMNEERVSEGAAEVFRIMNAYGVTSAFDAGSLDVGEMLPDILASLQKSGAMTVRLVGSLMVNHPDKMEGALDQLAALEEKTKSDLVEFRVLKIMDDGTIEGRTAGMFEEYQNDPGNKGATVFTVDQLVSLMNAAVARGYDVHVHALGERAISETLDAIEIVKRDAPADSPSRFTICHVQVIVDKDLERFARLGVIAQSTPLWASYDDMGRQFVSDDQFQRYFRYNSLKQAGVRLTFGSDYPASGAGTLGMSPLYNMEIGHTRQYAGTPDAPIQPRESERLDIASLIRGYTLDAAYQLHLEDQIGSIEVGKKADLVVLGQNPFDVNAYDIHRIPVLLTMMGGKVVYEKPEQNKKYK
ncbi:amidohydrolase [Luteithermobacter gelatinilyticus]|uniref:amidohydrolase n=1 Tax=Luteithermobacter gelatinilyticus TaxID=2582913 RepID=UPI0011063BD5|nr:amidohydrolase [Luteithermobacter gelatinilyticus]